VKRNLALRAIQMIQATSIQNNRMRFEKNGMRLAGCNSFADPDA